MKKYHIISPFGNENIIFGDEIQRSKDYISLNNNHHVIVQLQPPKILAVIPDTFLIIIESFEGEQK